MLEVIIWSTLVGSLGVEALAISNWLKNQHHLEEQRWEEEEILTNYSSDRGEESLINNSSQANATAEYKPTELFGWEFKIVRANRDLFRYPHIFDRLCQEEAEVGWILLEKLDDRRVRFKRPIALRERQKSQIPRFDPYRSYYGSTINWGLWLGAIGLIFAMILPACLGYLLISLTLKKSTDNIPFSTQQTQPIEPKIDRPLSPPSPASP